MISGKKLLNDESLKLNIAYSQKNCKYICSAETCQANPGEVSTDSNSLGKIKNIVLNTLLRTLAPYIANSDCFCNSKVLINEKA